MRGSSNTGARRVRAKIDEVPGPERFPINVASASNGAQVKSGIVQAEIDLSGNVLEEELVSAADPALSESALDLVKSIQSPAGETQRQAYINVRYIPESQ